MSDDSLYHRTFTQAPPRPGVPLLPGYDHPGNRDRNWGTWLVPCDGCGALHTHGAAEGDRAAHCAFGPYHHTGYWLQFAGSLDEAGVRRLVEKHRTLSRRMRRNHEARSTSW